MRFRTYLVIGGILFGTMVVGGLLLVIPAILHPSQSLAGTFGLIVIVVAIGSYLTSYFVIRAQLNRYEGRVPMPGMLGILFDITDDGLDVSDEYEPVDYDSNEAGGEFSSGGTATEILATCPHCGLRELRAPLAPCRVCGYQLGLPSPALATAGTG